MMPKLRAYILSQSRLFLVSWFVFHNSVRFILCHYFGHITQSAFFGLNFIPEVRERKSHYYLASTGVVHERSDSSKRTPIEI